MAVFNGKKPGPAGNVPVVPQTVQDHHQASLIGRTLLIKGEVLSDDEVVIEGKIEGRIIVKNRVVVGKNGQVKADIEAREIIVRGKVTGNLKGHYRVEIVPEGVLNGNISAPKVVIADGAIFDGNIDMKTREGMAVKPAVVTGVIEEKDTGKTGLMAPWFLIRGQGPLSAARNMAVDEALFQYCHRRQASFLRLYSWDRPSFSLGASQRAGRAIDREFIAANGGAWVRRITGGKTVLHHREVTYAVVSSADLFFADHDLLESYLLISRVLVAALCALGLDAVLSAGSPAELSRSANPCFSFPTRHEIEVAGKKIVGSAQKRDRQALLQHGSIPLAMDYDLYAGGSRFPAERLRQSMVTLSDLCTATAGDLEDALVGACADFACSPLQPFDPADLDRAELAALEAKYASDSWNFLQ